MADLSKPTPARLEAKLAALCGYKMTWQETLAQKRGFIRGETGATDDELRENMPELYADVELAERDAEIARLTIALAESEAAAEGALMIIAEERAEVARLRAEVAEEKGWRDTLRYCEEQWQDERSVMLKRIARLRAGIRGAVEGDIARPLGERWREDGQPSDHDRCIHGAMMGE